jgi:hypothetical protein
VQPDRRVNLYTTRSDFEDGLLLAALYTSEGPVTISVKRIANAPVVVCVQGRSEKKGGGPFHLTSSKYYDRPC